MKCTGMLTSDTHSGTAAGSIHCQTRKWLVVLMHMIRRAVVLGSSYLIGASISCAACEACSGCDLAGCMRSVHYMGLEASGAFVEARMSLLTAGNDSRPWVLIQSVWIRYAHASDSVVNKLAAD